MSSRLLLIGTSVLLLASTALRGAEPLDIELQGETVSGVGHELTALAFDRDDTLWIGCRYGGIYAYRQGKFFLYNAYNTPLPDEGIAAICVDQHNTKWFASRRGYLFSFDGKQWRIILKSKATRELLGTIASIHSDVHDQIWIVTKYGRLFRLEEDTLEAIDPDSKIEAGDGRSPKTANPIADGRRSEVHCLDFDRKGNLWAGSGQGLLSFDGNRWTRPGDSETRQMEICNLWCNLKTGEIYLVAAGADFKEDPFGVPTGKLCVFKDGRSRAVTDRLPEYRIDILRGDQDGRFVASYMAPHGAIVSDGKQVQRYAAGTPLENETVTDIVFDKHGRIWFAGRSHGLCCLGNGKWKTFPPPDRDTPGTRSLPLPAWWKKSLQDLVREEPVDVDIHTVLENPRKYADKKIRIVGTIASSFEYMEMIDSQGERLGMWPKVSMLQDRSGPAARDKKERTSKSQPQEFLGHLEWGGYFGHLGGWRMQFTIVEVYPADADTAKKAEMKKQYLERLDKAAYDWPISEYLAETAKLRSMRERLQGAWILTDVQGEDNPLRGGKGSRWIISGDRLTTGSPGWWTRGTLRIDPSYKPAALDFHSSEDEQFTGGPRSLLGIVSIEGDKLQVCLTQGYTMERSRERPRPRRFAPDRDSRTVLFTLARDLQGPPPKADESAEPDDPDCVAALKKSYTRLEHDDRGNVVAADLGFVQFGNGPNITDASLAPLRGLHNLQRVQACGQLTDAGLAPIGHCGSLVFLELGGKGITDAGLEHLRSLVRLQNLSLRDTSITDAGLEKLKGLKRLESLTLESSSFTGAGLDFLSGCSQLQNITVIGSKVADDVFRHVARLPQLKGLFFYETSVSDSQAAELGSCINLESLYLYGTRFGDAGMKYVKNLHKLRELRLANTQVTDAGMAGFKDLVSLATIDLSGTQVGDAGVSQLNGLKNLSELFLSGTRVTDAGLKSLSDLPNLECLIVTRTVVTSAGVESLKRLPRLEGLYLDDTRFDNDGLECLKSFPNLRRVSLTKPRVTREAAEALAKELPKVVVYYDNGNLPRSRR